MQLNETCIKVFVELNFILQQCDELSQIQEIHRMKRIHPVKYSSAILFTLSLHLKNCYI